MRVLLLEDDPTVGDTVQGALKGAFHAANWVRSGQTAFATLACQHYDLVLLDLGLPGKDGQEVLAGIRARDNPVPVLIITARDGLDDRLRGLDGGADDYLLKPFEMAELLARMRAVLRRKGGSGAATRCRRLHGGIGRAAAKLRQPVRQSVTPCGRRRQSCVSQSFGMMVQPPLFLLHLVVCRV